jgi:spoIIIJ-associated protein
MNKITVTGKTVEEAIEAGLSKLQVSRDRVEVVILEQPSKGLFGLLGSKEAKVELTVKPDAIEEAMEFLKEIAESMKLDIHIERQDTSDGVVLQLSSKDDIGILIGRRGQTLDALQYLVNVVSHRSGNVNTRIILDAENFRERRRKTLEELAARLADKAVRSRREVVLEPMPSHERKIIHTYLQDHPHVRSFSKGEEPNRRIVIGLK